MKPSRYPGKRVLDLAVVVVAALPALALALVCAVLVRISSPGPVIFRQERAGLGGAPFTLLKFRTMRPDPDDVGGLPDASRITGVGRVLRRTSLDELPQLINVLRGEMSIVGPRPTLPYQVERYDERQRRRLAVRPGLTGLAQVAGRNATSWAERIELDLEYVDSQSLGLDLRLMWRSVSVVLSGGGVEGHPTDDPIAAPPEAGPVATPRHVRDRPRVLLVTTVPITVDAFMQPHVARWRARGWTVEVVTGAAHELVDHVVPMTRTPLSGGNVLATWRVRRLMASTRPDLVVTTTPIASAAVRAAAASLRGTRPSVAYIAQGFHFGRDQASAGIPFWVVERVLARWTDLLVVIAEEDASAVRRWTRWRPGAIERIHGIGVALVPATPAPVPDEQRPLVVVVGDLNENKRPLLALDAVGRTRCAPTLWFVGDGPLREAVEVAATGSDVDVSLLGFVDGAASIIAAADVLLTTSRREGIPRVVLEAMVAGTPVVATTNRGSRELLGGGCGFVVDDDPDAIARALDEAIGPGERRDEVVAAAQARVASYGEDVVVPHLADLLEDLLTTSSVSRVHRVG